jgi:hypothetical protein
MNIRGRLEEGALFIDQANCDSIFEDFGFIVEHLMQHPHYGCTFGCSTRTFFIHW